MYFIPLFLLLCSAAFSQNSISISNRSINTLTTYQLKLTFNFTSLSSTGKLTIAFPSAGYSSTQLTSAQCSPYTCQASSLSLSINNTLIPNTQNITLTILNVMNPGNTLAKIAQNLSLTFTTTTGNQTVTLPLGTFVSGTLQSCSIAFASAFVNTYSLSTITIHTSNPMANGHVQLTLPESWSSSATTLSLLSTPFNCSQYNCTYVQSFYNTLTVSNITAAANSYFNISLSNLLSPPISTTNSEIKAVTTSTDENLIDSSVSCVIEALSPKTFSLTGTGSTGTVVSKQFSPVFGLINADPVKVGDVVHLTVASLITPVSVSALTLSSNVANSQMGLISATEYQYTITNSNTGLVIPSGTAINLTGSTWKSPPYQTSISSSFTVTFLRNGYNYQTGTVSYSITPNTITSISISSNIRTVQRSAVVQISITTLTPLIPASSIIITLPSLITTFSCGDSLTVNGAAITPFTCVKNTSSHSIVINNFIATGTTLSSSSNIVIKFNVENQMATEPADFIVYTIYNTASYNISNLTGVSDKGSVTYTPIPSTPSCTASAASTILGVTTAYTILCSTSSILLSPGKLQITIPPQIIIPSTSPSLKILINSVEIISFSSTINTTLQKVTITDFLTQNLSSGSTITIVITSLINPQNYSTTSSFAIVAGSSPSGYIIQSANSNIVVTMVTPSTFHSIAIQRANEMNGQPSDFNIALNTSINIIAGYILKISTPSSITVTSTNLSCDNNFICNAQNSTLLSVKFTTNYAYNQIVNITITGLTNPRTYASSRIFNFTLQNSNSTTYESGVHNGITNTAPNSIVNFAKKLISPSQSFLSSLQALEFSITTKNSVMLADGEYFNLLIPSSFTGDSLYCLSPYSCSLLNSTIKITSTSLPPSTTFTITLSNLRTPSNLSSMQSGTIFFSISSYTFSSTPIDITPSSLKIEFTLSCDPNCQTCDTSNTSKCLTCYSNSSLSPDNQCDMCKEREYKDSTTGLCENCSSICKTCTSKTTCTSCGNNTYFIISQSTCVEGNKCPISTIPLSNICQPCDPSCSECQNTTIQCISCSQNYTKRSLTSSQCTLQCDSGLVKYNGYCQCFQCLTCSLIYTNCTSCSPSSPTPYLYNNTCLSSCPRGYYSTPNSTLCLQCQNNCSSCTATECLDDFERSLTGGKIIPVPFTLCVLIVVILGVVSKIICAGTFVPSFVVAVGGVVQVISWVVVLGLVAGEEGGGGSSWKRVGMILLGLGLGVHYLINIAALPVLYKYLLPDKSFNLWWRKHSNPVHNKLTLIFTLLFHNRYPHLCFSKSFNTLSLRAPLHTPRNLTCLYILSAFSFLPQILTISGCSNLAYDPSVRTSSQLFMEAVDVIVVNIVMIIFTAWNFVKPDDFWRGAGEEVKRYEDREVVRDNETIEEMKDDYLENMEIEEVVGGLGGGQGRMGRYINTRLHLEGLQEKVLERNRHKVVLGGIGKSEEGSDLNIGYKLTRKVNQQKQNQKEKQRWGLDGISESIQQFSDDSKSVNSRQPLSPQKVQQNKQKANPVGKTNFESKQEELENSRNQEIAEEISISNDSLVRYEIPLDTTEVDVIFSPLRKNASVNNNNSNKNDLKSNDNGREGQQNSYNQQNSSLLQKSSVNNILNKQTARKINGKRKRKIKRTITQHNDQEEQSQHPNINDSDDNNDSYQDLPQNSSELQSSSLQNQQNFSLDEVPNKPILRFQNQHNQHNQRSQQQHSNDLNNTFNQLQLQHQDNEQEVEPTLFISTTKNKFQSAKDIQHNKKTKLNQTTIGFGKQKPTFQMHQQQQSQISNYDNSTINSNKYHRNNSPSRPNFITQSASISNINTTPNNITPTHTASHNLPHHQFQRYFEHDSNADSLFSLHNNQLIQKKETISSIGSIKKNRIVKGEEDYTRKVVSKHILAPETPIKMPTGIQYHYDQIVRGTTTQPLTTIAEKPVGPLNLKEEKMLNQKLRSVEKIYLQKMQVKDSSLPKKN